MVSESILKSVQKYLHALNIQGMNAQFGIVFGSQALGTSDQWSDIDLLVISPRFDDMQTRNDANLLWRMAAQIDSRIEPIPCGVQQWENNDSSAIIEIARREGERIDVTENKK